MRYNFVVTSDEINDKFIIAYNKLRYLLGLKTQEINEKGLYEKLLDIIEADNGILYNILVKINDENESILTSIGNVINKRG